MWARLVPLGANNPNANNGVFYFNGNNDASNSNANYAARLEPCFYQIVIKADMTYPERGTTARKRIGLVT